MAKTLALFFFLLQITSFVVFAEELETLHHKPSTPLHPRTKSLVHKPLASPPHHHHHSPSHAPSQGHTPSHPRHPYKPPTHNHHQHHSPSPAPSHGHTPLHPRHPAKPPTHHHHQHKHHSPSPAPSQSQTPLHPRHLAKPPTHHHHQHQHHSPSPAPSHGHTPSHPRHPAKPPTHHHHQHQHHSPSPAPSHGHTLLHPRHPAKPPTHHHHHHPPAHAPAHTPLVLRSLIAVEGVVYVKSCNHAGVDTLKGATPLLGATVKFQCNNTKYKLVLKAKTNEKGYFYIGSPKNITNYETRHCNIVLNSAPNGLKPSNLHGGLTGARLKPVKRSMFKGASLILYTVGPLAFEPKCHH